MSNALTKSFNFLIYKSAEGDISVNALIKDESIWLSQKAMAELFGVTTPAISKHLKNIFEEGELVEKVVVSILEIPTLSGAGCGRQKSRGRFNKHRKITSDFDKEVRKMLEQSGSE